MMPRFTLILRLNVLFQLPDHQNLLQMLKIHRRGYVSGFGQIVSIPVNRVDVSDQNARQILIADIGGNYLI